MPLYLTVYPDPHPESTSVDGYAGREGVNEAWATIIAAAGNAANDSVTSVYMGFVRCSATADQYDILYRGKFRFDTSALGATANISDAVFSVYAYDRTNNFSQSVAVCGHTGGSNTTVVAADFARANFGLVDFANRITLAAWNTAGYNNFTFNATGIAAIAKTGITGLGAMLSGDIDASAPVPWFAGRAAYANVRSADQAGTDNDPKLYITYTAGGGTAHEGAAAITLAITTAGAGLKGLYGAAASTLAITTAAAGKKTLYGAAVATLAITTAAAGKKALTGAATALLSITTAGAGLRALYGAASATLSLTTAASGLKTLLGAATATLTLTTAAAGLKTLHGAGTALLELFTSGAGKKALYGAGTALLTLTASAALEVASLLPYAPTILEVFLPHNELIAIIETNTVEVTMQRTTLQVI